MLEADLNKLKVAELRDELSSRGLDTKGVKAALVKRLRTALNKEAREQQLSSGSLSEPSIADDYEDHTPSDEEQEDASVTDVNEGSSSPLDQKDSPTVEDSTDVPSVESTPVEVCNANPEDTDPIVSDSVATDDNGVEADAHPNNESSLDPAPETSPVEQNVEATPEVAVVVPEESGDITTEDQSKPETENQDSAISEGSAEPMEAEAVEPEAMKDSEEGTTVADADPVDSTIPDSSDAPMEEPPVASEPAADNDVLDTNPADETSENQTDAPVDDVIKIDDASSKGTKRKHPEETSFNASEEVDDVPIKRERKHGRERRTRWDTMKVEKEEFDENSATLDTYNSDLNLVIDASRLSAYPLTDAGFAFMWAGSRISYGVQKGRICFEVMVTKHLDVSHLPEDEPNPHVMRAGFSVEESSMQLGEDPLSYGYGGTGKISSNCQFRDYGTTFTEGDTITAFLNMDSDPVEIGFAKNGRFAGWAYKVNKHQLQGKSLFPHVLTKNCSFEINCGQLEKPFYGLPDGFEDYMFISCVSPDLRVRAMKAPVRREDCEMIMMCGLPGAGKTVWAAEYARSHPEKKFNVLGTNNIIDKMKVMGLPRKRNYHGRWDLLIQMATKCLNKLFEIGSKLRRNYILDQTNVYPTAQRRKMRNFEGFQRKAVVVMPDDGEYKRRCDKRDEEEGKDIPDHAVLEMKANFKLPEVCDIFDDVIFTEIERDDAEKLVRKYNEEGRAAVGPAGKRFKTKDHHESGGNMGGGGGGGGRGSRNSGGYDRDRRGRGGYNSPGPRNSWGDGPQGFGSGGGGGGGRPNNRGGFGGSRGYGGFDGGSPGGGRSGRGFDGGSPGGGGSGGGGRGGRGGFGGGGGGSPGGFGGRSPSGYGDYGGYEGGSPGYGDHSPGGYGGGYSRGGPRGGFPRGGGGRPPPGGYGGYNEGDGYGGGYGGGNYNDYRGGYGDDFGDEPGFSGGRGSFGNNGPPGGYRKDNGYGRGGRGGYGNRGGSGYGGNGGGGYGGGGYGGSSGGGGGGGGYGGSPGGYSGYGSSGGGYGGPGGYGSSSGPGYGGNNGVSRGGGGGGRGVSRGGGSSNRGYSGQSPNQPRGGGRGRGGRNWGDSERSHQSDMVTPSVQGTSYSSYGSAAKSGADAGATSYAGYDQSYSSTAYDTSAQAGYQSYGYQAPPQSTQTAVASSTTAQWGNPSAASASVATTPVAVTQPTPEQIQQQWTQYYQQQSQQQQYYSQYYGQVAAAAAAAATTTPVYGTGAYTTATK